MTIIIILLCLFGLAFVSGYVSHLATDRAGWWEVGAGLLAVTCLGLISGLTYLIAWHQLSLVSGLGVVGLSMASYVLGIIAWRPREQPTEVKHNFTVSGYRDDFHII